MSDGSRTSRVRRTSVWLEEPPGPRRRGGRAGGRTTGREGQAEGLDREKVTAAAVRLLDAEGLAGFSMRRLAAELGVTAMSVYWYVDRKDDLLELALDAVEGELAVPEPAGEGADWRVQLRQVAHELRELLRRHPWVTGMLDGFLNIGPCAVAHRLAVGEVLLSAGLDRSRADGALAALFSFVYGHAAVEAGWRSRCRAAGVSAQECSRALRARLGALPEYPEYPEYGAREEDGGERAVRLVEQRDFDVALDCVIAGIEAMAGAAGSAGGDGAAAGGAGAEGAGRTGGGRGVDAAGGGTGGTGGTGGQGRDGGEGVGRAEGGDGAEGEGRNGRGAAPGDRAAPVIPPQPGPQDR
ncbi:TetR/AcrR family transcriptional regulator [Streptomyces sp. NRRL S-1868]|uniref:TetR/AcrR family transcriptional regulator n=1 Tax=Streptomyces sp. NRRL S-1868 TaxID=1463892 RepID=UPI0007C7CBED|nr:TetR/AcrR family transcriptional regulator C-terminal domain-containing protein [Streptomyces sp. NRRL S-1868]